MQQKTQDSTKLELENYIREKLKNNSSPCSPKLELKERIETIYLKTKLHHINTKRSSYRNHTSKN
jgi:hypothetical protein